MPRSLPPARVLLLALALSTTGCAGMRGGLLNCDASSATTRIDIDASLGAKQTYSYDGVYARDHKAERAGDPCGFSMYNSTGSAATLLSEAGYSVQRAGDRLTVTQDFPARKEMEGYKGLGRVILTVRYAGSILEHNADRYDEAAHELTWIFSPPLPEQRQVRFVLQTQ